MAEHKDPVCGMVVLPESAEGKAEFRGETYYFCSDQCMREFQSNPAKYVEVESTRGARGVADASPESEPPHTTKGRMTAPKFGSSVSGGGNLEPPFPSRD